VDVESDCNDLDSKKFTDDNNNCLTSVELVIKIKRVDIYAEIYDVKSMTIKNRFQTAADVADVNNYKKMIIIK